jgi:small subunit ribosomal protein S21
MFMIKKGIIRMSLLVSVKSGNGEQAIRELKRKMQRELVFRSMKMSRFYEPPSLEKVRKEEESERRVRKLNRRRLMD